MIRNHRQDKTNLKRDRLIATIAVGLISPRCGYLTYKAYTEKINETNYDND